MTLGISRIFRSTDAGAPQFNQTAGTLTSMLKAVLVNGYGTTQPLGWTMEFESGNIVVFRSKMGTRHFLRVDDTAVNPLYAEVSAFAAMSSVSNGTERIPAVGSNAYLWKCTTNGTAIPWMIVGDEAGFWLFHKPFWYVGGTGIGATANLHHPVYFGDYNAWDIRNKWNYLFLASSAIATPSSPLHVHAPAATIMHYVSRGSSFARGCVPIGILPYNSNTYLGNNLMSTTSLGDNKLNGAYMDSAIHVYETVTLGSLILGSIPGVFEPICLNITGTITAAATAPVETVDSDGNISIFTYINHTTGNQYNTIGRVTVKIGKGFRNVQ